MPRKEIDYSKTVIYKIVCNDLNIKDIYVGHTTDFTKRKHSHKVNTLNESNKDAKMKVYQTIRANGGWENWSMIEIEKYPCCDSNEARTRERFWFEELQASLNMLFPIRSRDEYYEVNRDKINKRVNKYRLEHLEEISQKKKEDYQVNAERIKERVRKYAHENKDMVMGKKKEYYESHKERISEYKKQWYLKKKALSQQPA